MVPPTDTDGLSNGEFKDMKVGLILLGLMTVCIGGVCALFVPLMLIGAKASQPGGGSQDLQMLAPMIVMYAVLAGVLVTLGIGSMMARRWARALLLIFSWTWLAMGSVGVVFMLFAAPRFTENMNEGMAQGGAQPPPVPASAMLVVMAIFGGVIFVILPAAWIFFYQNRNVKATCEARDPVMRWTDRCPLPVLAVCLWFGFAAPATISAVIFRPAAVPFFGAILVGPMAMAVYLGFTALWIYGAWAFYKLDRCGWWVILAGICALAVSGFVTYSRHDVSELYALMGYTQDQIARMQKMSIFKGQAAAWISLAGMIPMTGYMVYLRRFFWRTDSPVV